MRANSIKLSFVYILSLLAIVSCLQEERSPEDILVPSPAQVETSDASLMLASKVPSGSEKLVQECGFYYSKDKSMSDTRKVAGVLAANNFTAELPDRTYGTTYYICAYVTNGHGSEIRSDLRTFQLQALEDYVEFGQVHMVSFDPASKQLMITIDTDIWAGVSVSEAGVCYGTEPTSLLIEGDHKAGVYKSETRAETGLIEILLNDFSEATQYYLRPYVKDGEYLSYGEVVPFYIPAVAKVSTFDAEAVTASGATLSGEVTDECGSPVTERGFAWIEGDAVPAVEDSRMAAGSGLGTMTATIEGLSPNKKFTFRAYATNASGTAYGEAKVFTTLVALPSLATSTISNVASTSATFNGVLANDGGESVSEVGFYYSTEKEVNPETAQKVSLEYSTYQKSAKELSANTLYSAIQSAQKAASDEGETFSIDVFSLGIKTKYYVKSYAVNSAGVAYGPVVSFETAGEIATIRTVGSSEVTTGSAVLAANVTTDNGEKITERGFVWMEGAGNPTTDSNKLKVSGEMGEYTATLEGLDPNKKYSFRAYAINAEGIAYGDVMSFTTKVALPALSNVVIPSLSSTTATLTSKVTYHGGETVTEVGFYYSTESDVDPETSQKVSRIYSEDTFSIEVANLGINTKYYVKAYAINSAGTAYSEINSFKTESSVPSVQTIGVADITPESALLSGSILSDNGASITERGFVWIQGDGTPTVDSHKLTATGTTGEFTSSLTGLEPNKKYSFRAYATNSKGTAYGEIMTFSTVAGLPALSSVDVSAITSTSATFASTVTDHGGETVSEVGFYYSTEETVDPTTSIKVSQKYAKDSFTSQISDLAIFTKYFVKAYATNSAGTAYSDVVEFKTLASTPVVNTVGSSDITFNSATLSGKVLTDNGAAITERGFVWIKGEGIPATSSNKVKVNGTTGDYTASLSDLEPNVTYSYCAYAINELGTSYGAVMKFETIKGLPTLGPVNVSNVTSTAASFSGSVTGHGGETVSEIGFYYSTDAAVDPSSSVKVNLTYSSDSFSSSVSGLAVNTKYYVKSYARNSVGTVYSGVISFTTLADVPVVNTLGSSDVTSSSAVLSGKVVTDNGATITERGFVWVQGEGTPTTSSLKLTTTGTTGDFYATIKDLAPNQKYSFRAYAINSVGTSYGETKSFTTSVTKPSLNPVTFSSITSTSATLSSKVSSHGGDTVSEVGFYYSTDSAVDPDKSLKVNRTYTSDSFSISLSELAVNTKYYVKAYATNSAGTVYSDIASFTTLASAPVVNTVGSSEISSTGAVLSGTVVTDNGAAITERGFVYMLGEGSPTTSSQKLTVSGTTGDFTASLKDLEPNKKYSFRAYAVNSVGTSYGGIMTFTTGVAKASLSATGISNITSTSATLSSKVTSHGGDTVSEVGFYYSTDSAVDPDKSLKVNRTYTSDSFSISISELAVNTKYYVKAYASNSAGTVYSDIASFTTLASAPVVNTVGSSEISSTGAVLSGTVVTDNGAAITERGFVYMLGEGSPTTSSQKLTVSGTTGDFTASLEDLEPNKKYSFRAYAVNSVGTSYGGIMTFTTGVSKASLSTTVISEITSTSAILSSKVTSHGGATVSEVGFYYSTDSAVDPDKSLKINRAYTSDSFSISISELAVNTKYYVKAYAVNSAGTVYSDVASFTTLASAPVVNTVGSSEISSTGAVLSGTVVTDNGAAITERGFVWLKGSDAPTTSSNKLKVDGTTGEFTSILDGLEPNQKYSFRAYAINSKGTSYGDIMNFTTVAGLPTLSAMKVSDITTTSATFTCAVTGHGGDIVSVVGFYIGKEESVDIETALKISEAYTSDSFTLTATDLEVGTEYYVKAYTKNSVGESYSAIVPFKTVSTAPTVNTIGYSRLSDTSVKLSGNVLDDNGEPLTDRGFVWVKGASTPTTSHNKLQVSGETGEYTGTLSDIVPNEIYSFRAYAVNSKGTSYGEVIQLQINISLPCVTTNDVTGVTNTSAMSGGVITDDGDGEILSKGVVWSLKKNPTIDLQTKTDEGEGNASFTSHLTDLRSGFVYYVRAYATNIVGTTYGEEIQFATTGEIQGTSLEAANSFIISYPGVYSFRTVKGNSNESVGDVASAEVLWESFGTDEQPEVGSVVLFAKYSNGIISFATPDVFCEGNAVIAARDANGTILWSWHIWLTDEPQGHVYNNNAGTMMDRNLGATSTTPGDVGALGLLYQWGRKDPFLGSSSISNDVEAKSTITWPSRVSSDSSNGTIEYAISHPTTFINYNSSNDDWYYTGSSTTDDTRWQSDKTIYDPCPVGWRVPDGGSSGVWYTAGFADTSYDFSNGGINFSISSPFTTWYPASGYRNDGGGALRGVGSSGKYWSVTPSSEDAYSLSFYDGDVDPTYNYYRASYGFSVRCLQEGTGGGPQYDNNFSTSGAENLSDAGTANSYIVSNVGTYSISPVKGNSSESVGSVASAEVLWETFGTTDERIFKGNLISGALYENGQIYFKTADSYREGNAVIAAKDAAGTILWSWHIWLTDQPQEQIYNNNAGTMMDRNLGATSATPGDVGALGLLYQWGRKDPFLGSASISSEVEAQSTITWPSAVSSDSSTGTVDFVTSYPTTFVKSGSSPYDWHYSSRDNSLWQSEKTIYDPCPVGWRVPDGGSNGVWKTARFPASTSYDSSNEGMFFSISSPSTTWYPASGYRNYNGGWLYYVGNFGCYWSVSPDSYYAYYMSFNYNGGVNPSNDGSRAYGFPVRCLQVTN